MVYRITFMLSLLVLAYSCKKVNSDQNPTSTQKEAKEPRLKNLLEDFPALDESGYVHAVIEIPAGTTAKWELNKTSGKVEWESVNCTPRIVNYIGYPGNYGMIPRTLLDKAHGGDGDPLDILVLGAPAERGSVISCKLIGVLYLKDRGEQDDKLIAVAANSPFENLQSMEELDANFHGVSEIISIWFSNYKGPGMLQASGFGNAREAKQLLDQAIQEYQSKH